jgi:hypothetical protein
MKALNILICGGDTFSLKRTAQILADDGVVVETSTGVITDLCFSGQEWDMLLIDLDGLTSFLRSLIPEICRRFPELPVVGISTKTTAGASATASGYGFDLDDYLFGIPHPEDLIVRFPRIAAKYLCDTGPLAVHTQPLHR